MHQAVIAVGKAPRPQAETRPLMLHPWGLKVRAEGLGMARGQQGVPRQLVGVPMGCLQPRVLGM